MSGLISSRLLIRKRINYQEVGKEEGNSGLETLLNLSAQAAFTDDCRTANELRRQIRQYNSPSGDWSRSLVHFFSIGLEARLAGSGVGTKRNFLFQFKKLLDETYEVNCPSLQGMLS
ncbi:hypothetical protein Patl1_31320 [Pistacia atlantica]|uniref:Uncharacterized protein n=1 Tax=Pistacia atlantica TaxID=434234 RepID=A0ACC1AEF5_9ROSI|nr:hypothetical protein Patl1_31320 [Pistacia atlantica]